MHDEDLKSLFAGSDEERLFAALYRKMRKRRPRNGAQRAFYLAWEATELLNCDGFEALFDQSPSLEDYADSFVKIGMPKVNSIFDRVIALIPVELRSQENDEALYAYLHEIFEELNKQLTDYFDATKEILSVLGRYVREHRDDFAEYADG